MRCHVQLQIIILCFHMFMPFYKSCYDNCFTTFFPRQFQENITWIYARRNVHGFSENAQYKKFSANLFHDLLAQWYLKLLLRFLKVFFIQVTASNERLAINTSTRIAIDFHNAIKTPAYFQCTFARSFSNNFFLSFLLLNWWKMFAQKDFQQQTCLLILFIWFPLTTHKHNTL